MSRPLPSPLRAAAAAFTLIEMIGVLAIMAIVASVLVPNVLRTMDRAAVKAEAETLDALGEQVKLYLKINGVVPTAANWITQVGTLADLAPMDLAINRRGFARVYLIDPAATATMTPRIIILSSMRFAPALPTAADISTAVRFDDIWRTADKDVPPNSSWAGWNAWRAVDGSGEFWLRPYLLIERIDLRPIYHTDLASFTFRLNNRGTGTVSFDYVPPFGSGGFNTIAPGGFAETTLSPRTRLNLYSTSTGTVLNYTYIVGTAGRTLTFDFDGTNWTPQ